MGFFTNRLKQKSLPQANAEVKSADSAPPLERETLLRHRSEALSFFAISQEAVPLTRTFAEFAKTSPSNQEARAFILENHRAQSNLLFKLQKVSKKSLPADLRTVVVQDLLTAGEEREAAVKLFQQGKYSESFQQLFEVQKKIYRSSKKLTEVANSFLEQARGDLESDEKTKRLLEFAEHIDAVIDYKEKLKTEISRRNALNRRREALTEVVRLLIHDSWNRAKRDRAQPTIRRTVQFEGVLTSEQMTNSNKFSNEQFEQTLEEVDGWTRADILNFNEYWGAVSLMNSFTRRNANLDNPENRQRFLQIVDEQSKAGPPKPKAILAECKREGIIVDINQVMDLMQQSEEELVISERSGPNHLELYERFFLTSRFYRETGDELFMGMYLMLITLGLIDDDTYNPLSPDKKLTQHLIVDAYAKRRTQDTETESAERWLTSEQAMTYFAWLKGKLNLSGVAEEDERLIIEKLLDHFWWNEVGRPSIEFSGEEDEYGPKVDRIYNKENVSFAVSREHGKYLLRKTLTPEARERMEHVDQLQFVAASAYFQLHAMINERRDRLDKPTGIGIEEVPLPERDTYYITVSMQNRWKKVAVDGAFFHSDEYGAVGSSESVAQFIVQFLEVAIDNEDWQNFDDATKKILQYQAHRAYSTSSRRHREKYQDFEADIANPAVYTTADLGIVLTERSVTNQPDPLIRSLYTNTFGGRKQMNMVFGIDQSGRISQIVNAVAHKYLDGAPARTESEHVFEQALAATEQLQVGKAGGRIRKDQVIQNLEPMEERHQETSRIFTGLIQGHDGEFRAKCNTIFSFYREKLGVEIDKNTIMQLAVHLFQDMTHSHFLESRNGILAPALSFYPSRALLLLNTKPGDVMTRDEALEIIGPSQCMKRDRMSVKDGAGIVPVNAMLTGANGASAPLRKFISRTAETLHPKVTFPLTRSTMTSAVSGSREPFPSHPLFQQDFFTTAVDDVYMDHGAFGFSDIGHDIGVTYRFIDNDQTPQRFKEMSNRTFNREFNKALETAVRFFETAMVHFENDAPFESTGKTEWKKQVQAQVSR